MEAEFDAIERRRKAQGFPPLTMKQVNRLGRVVSVREGVLHRMQATRERTEFRFPPLRITLLLILLAVGLAALGRILRR
jgi:hypothetical protein